MGRRMTIGLLVATLGATFIFAISLSGCANGISCTDDEVSSTEVTLENSSGTPVFADLVEYKGGREPDTWRACYFDPASEFRSPDEQYIRCGGEEAGQIEIRATSLGGAMGEASVYVREDECHVKTVAVTIVLTEPT